MAEEAKTTQKTGKYTYANGKRKTSVARVRLYKGTGKITVNGRELAVHLPVETLVENVKKPLVLTGNAKKYDVTVMVDGGGISSQSDAIRHGIAKGLVEIDPNNKVVLKKNGLITRDSRVKERKKFGLKRARKAPQFSKR